MDKAWQEARERDLFAFDTPLVLRRTRRQLIFEAATFPIAGTIFGIFMTARGWSTLTLSPALVVASFVVAAAGVVFTRWWIDRERIEISRDAITVVTRFKQVTLPWTDITGVGKVKVSGGWYPEIRGPGRPVRALVPNSSFGPFIDPDFEEKIAQLEVQWLASRARAMAGTPAAST